MWVPDRHSLVHGTCVTESATQFESKRILSYRVLSILSTHIALFGAGLFIAGMHDLQWFAIRKIHFKKHVASGFANGTRVPKDDVKDARLTDGIETNGIHGVRNLINEEEWIKVKQEQSKEGYFHEESKIS